MILNFLISLNLFSSGFMVYFTITFWCCFIINVCPYKKIYSQSCNYKISKFKINKIFFLKGDPLAAGLKFLPFIYTLTICINIGGILESAPPCKNKSKLLIIATKDLTFKCLLWIRCLDGVKSFY